MHTLTRTVLYWVLVALAALALVVSGSDLAVGDRHPHPGQALAGLLPQPVLLAVVAVLGLVLAGTAALMAAAVRRGTADPVTTRQRLLVAGGGSALLLALLTLSVELLAVVGYLPLTLVLAPFDETMRESLVTALNPGLVLQVVVVLGALLWGAGARHYLRAHPLPVPRWAAPESAARWGRTAVAVAIVPPVLYALSRFVWLFYPLGFDRQVWEEAQGTSSLLPGVWLGAFAVLGAVLTLGLVQGWGEVFPRWVPRLARRRVPVAAAVLPASFVTVIVVPAGISMIRQVLADSTAVDFISNWAAIGPTFLWPLWGIALGVSTLAYALRRRGEQPVREPVAG